MRVDSEVWHGEAREVLRVRIRRRLVRGVERAQVDEEAVHQHGRLYFHLVNITESTRQQPERQYTPTYSEDLEQAPHNSTAER